MPLESSPHLHASLFTLLNQYYTATKCSLFKMYKFFYDFSSLEQQVQELLVKPSFEEQGVQTDVVKLVCEERGTQMDADTSSPDGDGSDVTKKESIVPEDNVQESTYDEQEHELDSNVNVN